MDWLRQAGEFGISGFVQVAVMATAYYYLLLFFRGTRGAQVLVGLVLFVVVLQALTWLFRLDVLAWLLDRFTLVIGVAVLVIFQPEIRGALAELGRHPALPHSAPRRTPVDDVVEAVRMLSEARIGALIAVERENSTQAIRETGTPTDAAVCPELLASVFYPHTPLHDGGVVIAGERMVAAGCVFPLSQNPHLQRTLGTRHRAAVGITEETDAVAIVVSEETGTISACQRGRLMRGMDADQLRRYLTSLLVRQERAAAGRRPAAGAPWLRRRPQAEEPEAREGGSDAVL